MTWSCQASEHNADHREPDEGGDGARISLEIGTDRLCTKRLGSSARRARSPTSPALPRLAIQPSARHISIMMQPNLTPDEHAALIELLRDTIDRDRFPMSPRMKLLRSILEKLGIRSTLAPRACLPNRRYIIGFLTAATDLALVCIAAFCAPYDTRSYSTAWLQFNCDA
jgi:hypothetical protein